MGSCGTQARQHGNALGQGKPSLSDSLTGYGWPAVSGVRVGYGTDRDGISIETDL